ncbi:ABC-type multidrug transport system ATPase subunit [Thermosporothrix hazakensis]|jgi:ABC-type multidrug transport system ATPase subunit|uniref:ABC-type multidrug transport system ATPase subunit n=1 Tax=Thermosporothrix hazakensis TaxID=644383 RepID=A0A326TTS6_THEHA|nr:ABC transporter ATP-binding protein [Thermosporothrix hazakensis]PZW19359.1 ABC-type multidrug transport system ATPase subunit [Thermosporothrix hazakensis]GCE49890.1 ABC transporter ATP-binding protein [Thermosporothrix hazakensis]
MELLLQQVSKRYGKTSPALQDVHLRIGEGMFGLLGPNGAGKTTLLRMLATLIQPTSGQILFNGQDIARAVVRKQLRARLGYLPQEFGVYPDLTAEEFLEYFALLKGLSDRRAYRKQIALLLDIVNLAPKARKKIKTFSGGMKRRLGIAQALLGDPQVVIVDEPTAGLDPEERIHLRKLLTELAGERILILSTHVVEGVEQTCDTIAILDKGEVAFAGHIRTLLQEAEGYTWEFVANREVLLPSELQIMTMIPRLDGIHYRVVGSPPEMTLPLTSVTPTLEDGYVLRRKRHAQQRARKRDTTDRALYHG